VNSDGAGGPGSVYKTGEGIMALSGANTYTGGTIISQGTLVAGVSNVTTTSGAFGPKANGVTLGDSSTGTSSPTLLINAGGITVANPITVANFGTTDTIGGTNTNGTATYSGNITLQKAVTFTAASGGTVAMAGLVSGSGFAVTKAGAGAVILSNAAGNTYGGGTTVSAGTLYVNNTSNSGTGSGAVTVNSGGTLAGSGIIATSSGVAINSGGTLASGPVQTSAPNITGHGLTMSNTSLTVSGTGAGSLSANLTFDLAAGNPTGAGAYTFNNPNTSTSYLTLSGSSTLNFAGTDSVSVVDLTNGSLTLRQGTPYLLVSAASDSDYSGLVTSIDGKASDATLDGDGYVLGVYTGSGAYGSNYTVIVINQYGPDGVTPLSGSNVYAAPVLYLDAGNLEVVPEPGTWALMLGGLALLVVIQRRKNKMD